MDEKLNLGLYEKFRVERTDGTSAPGKKHAGCGYFVLDTTHDPFALPALRVYADACRSTDRPLAEDLDRLIAKREAEIEAAKKGPCPTCDGSGRCVDGAKCPCQERRR